MKEIEKEDMKNKCIAKSCNSISTHSVDREINGLECVLFFCEKHAKEFEKKELKRIIQNRK
ncbi:MAG: hypothetical protein ACOC85_02455 [Thermoplasmatota archaeon]